MLLNLTQTDLDRRQVYKLLIGVVNPRPIALVSTIDVEGRPNVAPFSWYNMVSASPPVVMFCPAGKRSGGSKDTLANIEQTGEFVINVVTDPIARQMVDTAAELPYGDSEFDFAQLEAAPSTHVKPPHVAQAQAHLECKLREVVTLSIGPGASHMVLGDILALRIDDEVLAEDGLVDSSKLITIGRLGRDEYCRVDAPYGMEIPPPPTPTAGPGQ